MSPLVEHSSKGQGDADTQEQQTRQGQAPCQAQVPTIKALVGHVGDPIPSRGSVLQQ